MRHIYYLLRILEYDIEVSPLHLTIDNQINREHKQHGVKILGIPAADLTDLCKRIKWKYILIQHRILRDECIIANNAFIYSNQNINPDKEINKNKN